ncbi:MAG: hypothetical protein M3O20_16015 [Acidobacteriota bacterium]|nr:hypothetical protein [Acidobacteriota bacterium]
MRGGIEVRTAYHVEGGQHHGKFANTPYEYIHIVHCFGITAHGGSGEPQAKSVVERIFAGDVKHLPSTIP